MRTHVFVAACLGVSMVGGCNAAGSSGSLDLVLSLPTQADLRPAGMTTVTVTATAPGESPVATTSVITDNRFTAGDLPVGRDVQIGVVLRDVSNRIVGVGEAGQTIDVLGDRVTEISIPVRRPFVYASSGTSLYSFDPTLDPRDEKFQGKLAGVTGPQFTVSVGGDRLAVVSSSAVQVVVTATNAVMGSIAVPAGVTDATSVPGTHKLAIAHATGIAIVDLDAATMQNAAVGPVDRVTVGPSQDGTMYAYGLIARAKPSENPKELASCSGSSSVVAVKVDAPIVSAPKQLGQAVSDLAAAPDAAMLFATLPCTGQIAKVTGDLQAEIGGLTLTNIAPLEGAAVLTVAGDRIWAAGTHAATAVCSTSTGDPTACQTTTPAACPQPSATHLAYVSDGANLIVASVPLDGGAPITLQVPGRRETMVDKNDSARSHAQVLRAFGAIPLDLVALPGGQYVGIVAKSRYYIEQLDNGIQTILPCLDGNTADWLLLDMASSSIAQRVRTSCSVFAEPGAFFSMWECDTPPAGESSMFMPNYQATSVGALFGAR